MAKHTPLVPTGRRYTVTSPRPFPPLPETLRSQRMPFPSTFSASLLNAAAVLPDTIIARMLPERGVLEWASGILQIVVLLLGVVVLVALTLLLLSMRTGVRALHATVDRITADTKPLLDNAAAIVGDAREAVAIIRTDVERASEAAHAIGEQVLHATDVMAQRVDDVKAVLDVLQQELEDTAVSAVAAIRGVRAGAGALSSRRRRARSTSPSDPLDADDED